MNTLLWLNEIIVLTDIRRVVILWPDTWVAGQTRGTAKIAFHYAPHAGSASLIGPVHSTQVDADHNETWPAYVARCLALLQGVNDVLRSGKSVALDLSTTVKEQKT